MAHVQLAGGGECFGAVGDAVDDQAAHAADAFAAVVVEGDGLIPGGRELVIEYVEHFQERHVGGDPLDGITDHPARGGLVVLAPDAYGDFHL